METKTPKCISTYSFMFTGMVYFTLAMARSIVGKFHGPVSECFRYLVAAIFHLFFQLYQKNSAKNEGNVFKLDSSLYKSLEIF